MVMMGFESSINDTKGFTCTKHCASLGCRNTSRNNDVATIGSRVLINLYRIALMRSNKWVAKRECKQRDSTFKKPTITAESVRQKNLDYPCKKPSKRFPSFNCGINRFKNPWTSFNDYLDYKCWNMKQLMENYRTYHFLNSKYDSVFMFIINLLFFGVDAVKKNEVILHAFSGPNLSEEIRHKSLVPLPSTKGENYITYYPHLKLMFANIPTTEDIDDIILRMDEFPYYHPLAWKNDPFSKDDVIKEKTNYFINRYGLPSTVVLDRKLPEIYSTPYDPFAIEVDPFLPESIMNSFNKILNRIETMETFKTLINGLKMDYYQVKNRLPNDFWCGNDACRQKFFINCLTDERKEENYKLFGMAVREADTIYHFTEVLEIEKLENFIYDNHRLELTENIIREIKNDIDTQNFVQNLSPKNGEKFHRYVDEYVERLMFQESFYNSKKKESLITKKLTLSKNKKKMNSEVPALTLTRNNNIYQHSISLVRSFNLNWFRISNDIVTPIDNFVEYFTKIESKFLEEVELTVWQRESNYEDLLKTLRKIIKPIKKNSC
ncbi:hypothetical protein SNEBB_004736 [Seison nebaliae]|nr:hypothetical protein SNEBB_004736 [Seison nebaliae]